MKIEIKNDGTKCEYFKIDGHEFGKGITSLDIHIEGGEKPEIVIRGNCENFILDSEDNKLYIARLEDNNEPNNS